MNDLNQSFEKEEITIKELLFIVRRNLKTLFSCILLFLFFAFIYIVTIRPTYTSSATIIIEEQNSSMSSIFDMGLGSDLNYLENEIEVLKFSFS